MARLALPHFQPLSSATSLLPARPAVLCPVGSMAGTPQTRRMDSWPLSASWTGWKQGISPSCPLGPGRAGRPPESPPSCVFKAPLSLIRGSTPSIKSFPVPQK